VASVTPHEVTPMGSPLNGTVGVVPLSTTRLVFVRYGGDVLVEAPPTGSRVVATVPLGPMRVTMGAKHSDVVHDSGFLLSKDGQTLMQPDPWAGALVVAAEREKLAEHQRIVLGGDAAGRMPGDPTGLLTHACTRAWAASASITDDTPDEVVTAFKGAIEDHLLTAMVLACHSDAAEATTMTPGRVEELRQWLELNHGIEITTVAMARQLGLSVRQLQSVTHARLGVTPTQLLREIRLQSARRRLRVADPHANTVASIAHESGFAHVGRFSTSYAQRFGEYPAATLRGATVAE
jgi:AraC-like DNA-binding protein